VTSVHLQFTIESLSDVQHIVTDCFTSQSTQVPALWYWLLYRHYAYAAAFRFKVQDGSPIFFFASRFLLWIICRSLWPSHSSD